MKPLLRASAFAKAPRGAARDKPERQGATSPTLIHHQGIICGVAFDRSFLRRIAPYASVVAPRRRASNTLMVIRAVA
jgi:hypothetical protein